MNPTLDQPESQEPEPTEPPESQEPTDSQEPTEQSASSTTQPEQPEQPAATAEEPAIPSGSGRRKVAVVGLSIALVLVLVAGVAGYVLLDRTNTENAVLEAELADARSELERLREQARDGSGFDQPDEPDDLEGDFGSVDPAELVDKCLFPDGPSLTGRDAIPDGDVDTKVAAIIDLIEADRGFGLDADADFDIEFLSEEELAQRVAEEMTDDLDAHDLVTEARLLEALGGLEPDTDLAQEISDALEAGVSGYYDPETRQLVIGSAELDALGVITTAHELVHAMTDRAFGLPDREEIAETEGADAAFAALSVIEGDASLYGMRFAAERLPIQDLLGMSTGLDDDLAAMEELPYIVRRSLEFPYLEGMAFSCEMFDTGGWDAVDATYEFLPTTTAQILFPERYRAGEGAVDVRRPAGPDGWDVVLDPDTLGAADLMMLLEAPGGDEEAALSDPKGRVEAWAGGEVTMWTDDEGATAVGLVLADRGQVTPLCETIVDYYTAAFGDEPTSDGPGRAEFAGAGRYAVVACDGDEVALGIGPDAEIAAAAIS